MKHSMFSPFPRLLLPFPLALPVILKYFPRLLVLSLLPTLLLYSECNLRSSALFGLKVKLFCFCEHWLRSFDRRKLCVLDDDTNTV